MAKSIARSDAGSNGIPCLRSAASHSSASAVMLGVPTALQNRSSIEVAVITAMSAAAIATTIQIFLRGPSSTRSMLSATT